MFLSIFGGRDKNIFEHLSKLHVARTKVDAGGKSILVIMSRNNNIISVLHGRLSKLKVLKKKIDMSGGVLRACFTLKACKSLQTSFTLVGTCQTTNVPFMCRTKCVFKKRCMLAQFHFHSSKVKPQTKKSMDFFSTDDKHLTQAKYNLCEELSQVQSNGQNAYLQYLLFNA